jgi:hypothetical protein
MPATAPPGRPSEPGETLTRRTVTVITAAIAVMAFAFSLGNVTSLALYLKIPATLAWLIGPMVDLSVIGLLIGVRYLSLRGWSDAELFRPRCLLLFSGLLTLALNTAKSLAHHQYGTALADAVAPALLLGWSEIGPWMLRQIHTARAQPPATGDLPSQTVSTAPPRPGTRPGTSLAPTARPTPAAPPHSAKPATAVQNPQRHGHAAPKNPSPARRNPAPRWNPSPELLSRARVLDADHRARTGRPISRDILRAELSIARDRAAALITHIRGTATGAMPPTGPVPITDR